MRLRALARLASTEHDTTQLLTYLEVQLARTPLELLARAASEVGASRATVRKLFDSYDRFLGILDNSEKREALARMTGPGMAASVWEEIRDASHDFHCGLLELFFDANSTLSDLTIQYGLF